MNPLDALDNVLRSRFTRSWRQEGVARYIDRLRADDQSPVPAIRANLQVVDGKAGALLTYTSMMVAALGIAAVTLAENQWQQAVIVGEIMLYLCISLLGIRTIALFREPDYDDERTLAAALCNELILRESLYRFCNRATIYVTMLVLVSLPVLFVL
jgi:hypothetical protein